MKLYNRLLTVLTLGTVFSFSSPAQTWSVGRMGLTGIGQPRSIAYGNGRFVASYTPGNNTVSLAYSDDGTNWSYVDGSFVGVGGTVVFHNEQFYYASGSSAYRSADGVTWTRIATIPGGGFASAEGFATNGSTFLFGSASTNQPSPLVTSDFETWNYAGTLPTSAPNTKVLGYHPAYGNGHFILTYSAESTDHTTLVDQLATSADGGSTWTEITGLQPYGNAMAFGNGRFVVLGNPRIYTSSDGETFETHFDMGGLPANTQNLTFAGGRFIAYSGATFYVSSDGLSWSPFGSVPTEYEQSYISLAYGKGRYVGITRRFNPAAGAYEEVLLVASALAPPRITHQPQSITAPAGSNAQFSVETDDSTGLSYSWYKGESLIAGATTATLTVNNVSDEDAGNYRCVLSNSQGSATSNWASLAVGPMVVPGHLTNLSVITLAGSGESTLTAGIVLSGTGQKPVLIRAIGPTLANFSVPNPVANPALTLVQNNVELAANDDWSGDYGASLGAFPLSEGSTDAVISSDLSAGLYTAQVVNPASTAGNALIEVYDAAADNQDLQLANLSARVGLPVSSSVTIGFVISGDTPMNILIRAIGPGLSQWISGTLPNPKLTLFKGDTELLQNDDWTGPDGRAVGAFALTEGSFDSVISTTLEPGLYSARAESVGTSDSGIVLVEFYVLP